jgi:S1-C subfamily serine protease
VTELIPGAPLEPTFVVPHRPQSGGPVVMVIVMVVVSVLGVAAVVTIRATGAYPSQASSITPDALFAQPSLLQVDAPDPALVNSPAVAATRASVLKIHGVAPRCQKFLEGSGFVVAPNAVMSAAHNVAGAATVTVEAGGRPYDASVVSYDPREDIAILDVPGLPSPPLRFDTQEAQPGSDAVFLGYPEGGDFAASPARIREVIELSGPDIYNSTMVSREVYTVRGAVRHGNSGGPLIGRDGGVLGVVFGAAVDDADVGFALTSSEVSEQMAKVTNGAAVATGTCVG